MHEQTVEDLIGKPSPDTKITDFSNRSANVIMPEDVDAIADQLEEGDWIVAASGSPSWPSANTASAC